MEYVKFSKFIISTQYGYTAEETSLVEGDAKYLRITDIVPYFVNKEQVPFCKIDDNKKKKYLISENDLLIARTGATTGYNLVVDESYKNFVFASYLIRFNYNKNELYPLYLKYVLKSQQWYGFVNNFISGSAQPGMNAKVFGKFQIPFFNYDIQKRISNILSTYDKLIDNNNKRIKLLEQMAENLYKEWFVRFRFPGYEDAEFENGIPKEWEYTKLERLANISTGKCNREDAEEDGAYPLFDRSQEIKRSNVWLKDCEAIIVPGEGTSFIRYYNGKFNLHQRCYCVEPSEKGMGFFLYQTLMMYRKYFLYVATGATVPSLRLNNFNNFKALLPKKELCFQYNGIAEKMNDEILLLKNKNELLTKQRDLLLPRLMSGKLEV